MDKRPYPFAENNVQTASGNNSNRNNDSDSPIGISLSVRGAAPCRACHWAASGFLRPLLLSLASYLAFLLLHVAFCNDV